MQSSKTKILVINPNITGAMLDGVLVHARRILPPAIELVGVSARRGVAVISTRATFAIAAQSVLETWACYRSAAQTETALQAIVVACFGDPGVAALRELVPIPVFGLAEASLRSTARTYGRFAIVTAGPVWKSMLDELVRQFGLEDSYAGTHAIDANGLGASRQPEQFRALIQNAIEAAEGNGAQAIVLGGAALAGSAHLYQATVPLVDCVKSAFASIVNASLAGQARDFPQQPLKSVESVGLAPELAELLRQ